MLGTFSLLFLVSLFLCSKSEGFQVDLDLESFIFKKVKEQRADLVLVVECMTTAERQLVLLVVAKLLIPLIPILDGNLEKKLDLQLAVSIEGFLQPCLCVTEIKECV